MMMMLEAAAARIVSRAATSASASVRHRKCPVTGITVTLGTTGRVTQRVISRVIRWNLLKLKIKIKKGQI